MRLLSISLLLISLFGISQTIRNLTTYEEFPEEYRLLIPQDVFETVLNNTADDTFVESVYYAFDRPLPVENITTDLRAVAPIFEDKMMGFVEKIGFHFDQLKLKHPRSEKALDQFEGIVASTMVSEAIDFFAFTPTIDIKTFQEASSTYGPLMHVKAMELNEEVRTHLPTVYQSIDKLSTEFNQFFRELAEYMLDVQLEVVEYLKNTTTELDYSEVEKLLKANEYEIIPETIEVIKSRLAYPIVNAMGEIRYKDMDDIKVVYDQMGQHKNSEQNLIATAYRSSDIGYLNYAINRMLNTSLEAVVAHKKFTLVRDITTFGAAYSVHIEEALPKTNFIAHMDGAHQKLQQILKRNLALLLATTIGSVPRLEHRAVRRLVAKNLPLETLFTKIPELEKNAPYLMGKVLYGANKLDFLVRRFCYNNMKMCDELKNTTALVKNYYTRGMLRIFDLLPDEELSNIKKIQTGIKLEKYKTVMLTLYAQEPSLYKSIEKVHLEIEKKIGSMQEPDTQEFTRKLEADTLRVLLLLALNKDADVEEYTEYARSWVRGFSSLKIESRAEIAVAMPDFVKSLTT